MDDSYRQLLIMGGPADRGGQCMSLLLLSLLDDERILVGALLDMGANADTDWRYDAAASTAASVVL